MFLDIFHDIVRRHLYDKPPRLLIEALEADAAEPCVVPVLTLSLILLGEGFHNRLKVVCVVGHNI